ncbi:NAD-dependent protein deacylase Sirt4-like [Homalodisca vitripennis]|uniref:NAD-dependent protein deacylase Sirt4-like n=1 Tax=Homalodisca vitripennis TaxID=197043 RepID=UPI001EEC8CC3|nr:NAD-dependent protein deacylase Sirt4-like [Homalodisca vitripennis]
MYLIIKLFYAIALTFGQMGPLRLSTDGNTTIIYRTIKHAIDYVPKHNPISEDHISTIKKFFKDNRQVLVLTGAGVSTESGIPDYRSEGVGLFARSGTKPVQYQEFLKYPKIRQRYWARNFVGWPNFSSIAPNQNHAILKHLEDRQQVQRIITQNVDNLHSKAGSRQVIELHGTAFKVVCLSCDYITSRFAFQKVLSDINQEIIAAPQAVRPDGDIDLPQEFVEDFKTPACPKCGGMLKPDIVFFGDNVPKSRVDAINDEVDKCDALLVLGSSLSTYSGYRIILRVKELHKQVGIVNIGPTRADHLVDFKINAKCSEVLQHCKQQNSETDG